MKIQGGLVTYREVLLGLACFLPKILLKVPCTVWFFFMLPQATRAPGKDRPSVALRCPGLNPAPSPRALYRPMSPAVLPARATGDRWCGRRRSPGNASYLDR